MAVKYLFGRKDRSFDNKVMPRWLRESKRVRARGRPISTLELFPYGLFDSQSQSLRAFLLPDYPK